MLQSDLISLIKNLYICLDQAEGYPDTSQQKHQLQSRHEVNFSNVCGAGGPHT